MEVARLLKRLDDIGQSLKATGKVLALLGLGSVGTELERLDEYSDLDFFAIVKPGHKQEFLHKLDWLSMVCPIAYAFQNTPDGHKLLFEDGIFAEFAVFEPDELAAIPFTAGRIVWSAAGFDASLVTPKKSTPSAAKPVEWLVGEALTNVYVGLGRHRRGEKLSALRFIQGYAVDRIVELSAYIDVEQRVHKDVFANERRYEQRFPDMALLLPPLMQGYEHNVESAQAILDFLDQNFSVNAAMRQAIVALCEG